MRIQTSRLVLRPLGSQDLDTVFLYSSDSQTTRYMMWGGKKDKNDVRAFLENIDSEWQKAQPKFYEFAVLQENQQIGSVSAYLDDSGRQAELGWILRKDFWGRGFVTEAAMALRDFLFCETGVEEIIAHCDERNIASFRVMQKIGMELVCSGAERIYPLTGEKSTELMCRLNKIQLA